MHLYLNRFDFGVNFLPVNQDPQWPTQEMLQRGHHNGLIVGALIAISSGAGVALSVLSGNSGSMVGVAISASLLPPAVNAGLFWVQAILGTVPIGNKSGVI